MKKTKIIATLGPASFTKKMIRNLIISGMDVARINMSHEIEKDLLQNVIRKMMIQSLISILKTLVFLKFLH